MNNQNSKFKNQLHERIYKYTVRLINFIDSMPENISCNTLAEQLLRSGSSVGVNFVESHASGSKRDFTNFFHHALKSANETEYWLNLLQDAKNLQDQELKYLICETRELSKILAASILTLKGKKQF